MSGSAIWRAGGACGQKSRGPMANGRVTFRPAVEVGGSKQSSVREQRNQGPVWKFSVPLKAEGTTLQTQTRGFDLVG